MSDPTFDAFLEAVARGLRRRPGELAGVSDELRDHLEERLAELLQRGVPRAAAVQTAIDEWGEAAALAAQFNTVSRSLLRRWIVRYASGSVAAAVLLLLAALAWWPESANLPLTARATAQNAAPAKEPAKEAAKPKSSKDENNARTEAFLSSQRIPADFMDQEILGVIEFVAEHAKEVAKESAVQFYVDRKRITDAGVAEAKVNLMLRSVRLDMLLDLALKQAELGYYVEDGIVVVTTKEEIDQRMEVRVYNCRDLLQLPRPKRTRTTAPLGAKTSGGKQGGGFFSTPSADEDAFRVQFGGGGGGEMPPMGGAGAGAPGGDGAGGGIGSIVAGEDVELIDVLRTNIKPDSWKDSGGPGDVTEYRGMLVVSQTAEVHRRIEQLLEMLRASTAKELAPGK